MQAPQGSLGLEGSADAAMLVNSDEEVLAKMGYKQVLYRSWGSLTAIAITISAMSVLTSITASFGTGLYYGGPVVCVWGWLFVSFLTLCVGLGMAELASAYPTSGGMYYWMYVMAGERWGPIWCWVTGWLNLLGQIASITATSSLNADLIATMACMAYSLNAGEGAEPLEITEPQRFGIFAAVTFAVAVLNSCGLRVLTLTTQLGAAFHLAGVALLVLIVPLVAPRHNSAEWVFTGWWPAGGEESGLPSVAYIVAMGLLLPAYSYTGMDGPAHMSEEVSGSQTAPSKAILYGVLIMFVGGLSMILSLLFSMGPIEDVLSEDNVSGGNPIPQILYDVFNDRFGNPGAGVALQIIPILGVFFCTVATMTYVSRILFCYSRDRAVPLAWLWKRVDPRFKSPIYAVWGTAFFSLLLGLPRLGSTTAFEAILSLSTISLIVCYTAPILARISWGARRFVPGPFNLGRWSYVSGTIATCWAVAAAVIFSLPTEFPVHVDNLNYASIALLGTLTLSLVWYLFPVYGAYAWFKGPVHTISEPSSHHPGDAHMGLGDSGSDGSADLKGVPHTGNKDVGSVPV